MQDFCTFYKTVFQDSDMIMIHVVYANLTRLTTFLVKMEQSVCITYLVSEFVLTSQNVASVS